MSKYTTLAARIRESLVENERVVQRARRLGQKALQSGDEGYWDGVALNLHGFYAGVERIFEDIAQTVDEAVPGGAEWHRDLLLQISAELPPVRPAVISRETRQLLEDYRGFRHIVRNVYAFNLRPARIQELQESLIPCFEAVRDDLQKFVSFLGTLE